MTLRTSADERHRRASVCKDCPQRRPVAGTRVSRCALCGCFIAIKIQLRGQTCPAGNW